MRIRHIRNKFVLAGLAVILPFILWIAVSQYWRFQERRSDVLAAQQTTASDIANLFITYDHGIVALTRAAGMDLWNEQGALRPDASAYLSRVNGSIQSVRHLSAADAGGVIRASDFPDLIGVDHSQNEAVARVMRGADWALSNVFISRADGRHSFGIATGIRDGAGELQGIVLAMADEDRLRQVLHRSLEGISHVVITDRSGVIAFISGEEHDLSWRERRWTRRPFVQRALRGEPSIVEEFTMPDGHEVMGAVVPVPEVGWTAGVFTLREDVIGPIERESAIRLLFAVALTLLVLGVAVHLGNRMSRPILVLAGSVRAFGEGKLGARADVGTGDELQYLGDRFNDMADALESRDVQLRDLLDVQRRQRRHVQMLYRTAEGIIVTTSLTDKLQIIARALAELTQVKRCIVLLRRGSDLIGSTGWGIMHPETLSSYSVRISAVEGFRDVIEELKPIVVTDIGAKAWTAEELPPDAMLVSALVVPIAHAGRFVGAAILDNPGEHTTFSDESIAAAQQLTQLAAVAIENAQLFEREKHIAEVLQRGLLPTMPQEVGRLRLANRYYPALEFAEVGGDFYDYIELPDGRIGIAIADVSGKGLEAAVHTAMGRYTMRAFALENPSPADVLTRTNHVLAGSSREWGFITMFFGVMDPESCVLVYANAGHPPAVLVRAGGEVSCIECPARQPPLGIFRDIEYVERSLALRSGDMLIGYTDGLIEARADSEMFETDRLCALASDNRHMEPDELADTIYASAREFSQGRLSDDIAILIVKAR